MTVFGLVRSAVGNDESARSKYLGPTGKRSAGKLACSVWSGGKAVRPYLSLFDVSLCSAPRRQLKPRPLAGSHHSLHHFSINPLMIQYAALSGTTVRGAWT